MKERPILFSGPMVRALLDGSKTQTRRALRTQPLDIVAIDGEKAGREWVGLMGRDPKPNGIVFRCKFGQPGDRLYVRETWSQPTNMDPGPTVYRADYPACVPPGFTNLPAVDEITWKPSIHMPRVLSRILLEVVSVRVERLNDCSEEDARAEGITDGGCLNCGEPEPCSCTMPMPDARDSYCSLWESINGAGSWLVNPWVWVVEFRRVAP